MINVEHNSHHNERIVRFFLEKAYPNGTPNLDKLINDNVINGYILAEIAVSNSTGIGRHPIGLGCDLSDLSDVKTATVHRITNRVYKETGVSREDVYNTDIKVRNNKGLLRCIVYNPFFSRWYFFLIPPEGRPVSKRIKISFSRDTGNPTGRYAKYEVENWEKFCSV